MTRVEFIQHFLETWEVKADLMGIKFDFIVSEDLTYPDTRIFIQCEYTAPCTKNGDVQKWKGSKSYLSDHMTDDEIIKTCYATFEKTVRHEIMEGFQLQGKPLFNPHTDFRALLSVSDSEITRPDNREEKK